MSYNVSYDRTLESEWQRAYDDADSYQPLLEPNLIDAITQGASLRAVQFAAQFGGVQGFPVEAMYKILRNEVSQTS